MIEHGEVDIFQAVKTVRRHRPQLVDNMTEYKYCYDLVLHYVLHYLNKDLNEKKWESELHEDLWFIEFGRGKSIPLTPEYANSSELSTEISNTGRVIVKKSNNKLEKGELYNNISASNVIDDKIYVMDRNGRMVERKKKGRLYSLGGNEPLKKCNRGRLDRLKTVGTFDLSNELSILSQKTMNLNEKIINTQSFIEPPLASKIVVTTTPSITNSSNRPSPKSRSLSTGSYMASSDYSDSDKIIKSNSNSDMTTKKQLDNLPKNKSLEEASKMMKINASNSPIRKPILRKSKKIIRTDSEFLKGNIYDKESLSSSQYTPSYEKRREFASIHNSSNPSSEHKSTDESSKNISTDEVDTVFSDTMDLEQLEQDYKMQLKNNLQREYKSDSDTLDEVGKKKPINYENWKNQSYDNTFDLTEYHEQEDQFEEKDNESEKKKDVDEKSTILSNSSSEETKKSIDKEPEKPVELKTVGEINKPPPLDRQISNLFEKNFGRFKRMNKLLKSKRFSTSALYDKKIAKPSYLFGQTSPVKLKSEGSTKKCFTPTSAKCSKKVFTFKGRKFLPGGKSSPTKSKSSNEINYFRTTSTKGSKKSSNKTNSAVCLNSEPQCTSPLSEAFYNTTGSVRLSAMELYEKFCSQDFSGLYKHEMARTDAGDSGTDSGHYEPNRNLGNIIWLCQCWTRMKISFLCPWALGVK